MPQTKNDKCIYLKVKTILLFEFHFVTFKKRNNEQERTVC